MTVKIAPIPRKSGAINTLRNGSLFFIPSIKNDKLKYSNITPYTPPMSAIPCIIRFAICNFILSYQSNVRITDAVYRVPRILLLDLS